MLSAGCPSSHAPQGCVDVRGGLYSFANSSSWTNKGFFELGPNEVNLGYNVSAEYGMDTVSLGFSNATGGPTLQGQVVAGYEKFRYYVGSFGLSNQPTNFSSLSDSHPSFLASLRSQDLIPSLSWGYTAGAHYRTIFLLP